MMLKQLLLIAAIIAAGAASAEVPGITLGDAGYDVSLIDSDESVFFVSQAMDLSARLFVGAREGLYVYEPKGAGFGPRQELYRFPKDSWLYDLEVYGDDLFVLCNTALYRIRGAVTKREGLKPEKLLWGLPQGHFHQGMHGMELGPTGDLFLSMGDPQPHMHWNRSRPDHLWHWTFYVGPENKEQSYTGVGAIFRYRLADHSLSIHASGLRNTSGISFDPQWRLFANDNDQEGSVHSPCRLVYAPQYSWHGWVRGWADRHNPARRDILPVANLELDVPVGQCWHDGAVLVANWGNRSVSRHPMTADAGGFTAPSEPFLVGEGLRRPVSVTTTLDGRLVVSVCYMQGNEGSPVRQTDLLLLTPKTPVKAETWALRYRNHQEILRKGGAELAKAAEQFLRSPQIDSSLIYLAAAHGDEPSRARIHQLAAGGSELAIRVMAEEPAKYAPLDVDALLAKNSEPQVQHALLEYLHAGPATLSDAIAELAASDAPFVRQSAAQLLAQHAADAQLKGWAAHQSEALRQAAVNAAGFQIWEAVESTTNFPKSREQARNKQLVFEQPDGKIDLAKLGKPVFIYMPSAWWSEEANRESMAAPFALLSQALQDSAPSVRIPAAVQLFFLRDARVDDQAVAILNAAGIDLASQSKASQNAAAQKKAMRALKKVKLAKDSGIPPAFAGIDWESTYRSGKPATGKELFTARGCVACHLAPDDGKGGGIGPSLEGVHNRFDAQYLAESILLPNRFVSPNFHPTTLTMKDGNVHTGFVEAEGETVDLRMVTGAVMKLTAAKIAKRETSHQSMMPAGLVQTPEEMNHLLAYMLDRPASLSDWNTGGNWAQDAEGSFFLTPRPGEKDWKRYGHYLWSKKAYQDFEIDFEYKHEKGGNSGLYFNVANPQEAVGSVIEVQIKDSAGETKLGAHGVTGGILPGVDPTANASKPAGQWNHMSVRSQGGEVTVTLNGKTVNQVKLTHRKLASKPKKGFVGFQDHGLPFWLRKITLRELSAGESAAAAAQPAVEPAGKAGLAVNVQHKFVFDRPNVFRFPPTEAKHIRVQILSGDKAQPCIDEFEVFVEGSQKNLALESNGGKASASSLLPGYSKHKIEFLNDGKYGNLRSWIPAKNTGWAQITLAKVKTINRVVLSRDREGKSRGRLLVNFDIQLSSDGKTWTTVKRVRRNKAALGAPPKATSPSPAKAVAPAPKKASVPLKARPRRPQNPPNIVLILADDYGWGDASCNNPDSPLKTPAIDRIAKEGIRLTNAHTPSAVCTPTRYGVLTGRYPWRSYLQKQVLAYYAPAMITKDRTTLPSYLKTQGYRTAGFGKWHLGLDWTPKEGDPAKWRTHWNTRDKKLALKVEKGIDHSKPFQNAPTDIGFDTYFGTPSNCSRLPFFIKDNRVYGNPKPDKEGWLRDPDCDRTTVDDIYVEQAIRFMDTDSDKPFFVYLPLNAIHGATKVPPRYAGKTGMTQREDKILWVNESVSKILAALDQMNMAEDTLLIFTTDNGPTNSPAARDKGHQPTGPYRGLKTNIFDGGTRVPFVARWPGHIPAGATSDKLVGLTDMLATFAALCGTPLGDGAGPDSHNVLPVLLQQADKVTEHPPLVTASYEGFLTLRQGNWKAVFGTKWHGGHPGKAYGGPAPKGTEPDDPSTGQLYKISTDPFETQDLWASQPEVVKNLTNELRLIQEKDPTDSFRQ